MGLEEVVDGLVQGCRLQGEGVVVGECKCVVVVVEVAAGRRVRVWVDFLRVAVWNGCWWVE